MSWKVFAEDAGTGLQTQDDADWGDGANFNALAHNDNAVGYSVKSPSLNPDYTVPEVALGEAQFRVRATDLTERDHNEDGSATSWPEATLSVKAPATTLALTDNDTNHIFLNIDLTTSGDDAGYVVNTTGSAPTKPSLKVAEVDTSNNTANSVNSNPEGVYEDVQVMDYSGTWLATWMANIDSDKLDSASYTPEQDTHNRYSDNEARTAVDGANVDITGDSDTVDGYHGNDLARPKNSASFSSTDTSTNINQNSWTVIPWDVQLDVDAGYSHEPANSPGQITFDNGGTYKIHAMLSYDSNGNTRINPGIKFSVNGTRRDRLGLSGYVRSRESHAEASNYLTEQITVNSGDTLRVETHLYGSGGAVTLRDSESLLLIEQVSETVPIADDADTVDGKHAADFVLESEHDSGGVDVQTFTSSGTWNKPNNVSVVAVDVISGGGGGRAGSDSSPYYGTGGGGGGRTLRFYRASNVPDSVSVTVASGGSGGSSDNESGYDGGSSSFGDLITVIGGKGGEYSDGGNGGHIEGGGTSSDAVGSQGASSSGNSADWGGASGADRGGKAGGSSLYAAGGGGGGGQDRGGNGGSTGTRVVGDGPSPGTSAGHMEGGAGKDDTDGENGGFPGGGGGGGGYSSNGWKSGGDGADGLVVVRSW